MEDYFHVRWLILRKPWDRPPGSERLEDDDTAIHVMAVDEGQIVGVVRGHFRAEGEGQVRLMGVLDEYKGTGLAPKLLVEIEQRLREAGANVSFIQARDYAVGFYKRNGYEVVEETYLLWGRIQHYLMKKEL